MWFLGRIRFNHSHQATSQSVSDSTYLWHPSAAASSTYAAANTTNQYPTVGGVSYTYDGNGNLKTDGTWTYTYDTENQLLSAVKTGTTASYVYDPLHRQAQKTVGSTKTRFIYGGVNRVADYDGTAGTLQNRYVYGDKVDQPLIQVSSGGTITYFHQDRANSVVATSSAAGAVANKNVFSPYGESNSLTATGFGYSGQRYDAETGLYYYKARYYSTTLGRFLQTDPVGYQDDVNLYTYVKNDPLNRTDYAGRSSDSDTDKYQGPYSPQGTPVYDGNGTLLGYSNGVGGVIGPDGAPIEPTEPSEPPEDKSFFKKVWDAVKGAYTWIQQNSENVDHDPEIPDAQPAMGDAGSRTPPPAPTAPVPRK